MTQSKKYSYRVVEENKVWSAEILRRASSKKTIVSKKQDGFASEAEAKDWGEQQVVAFLKNMNERELNKRREKKGEAPR